MNITTGIVLKLLGLLIVVGAVGGFAYNMSKSSNTGSQSAMSENSPSIIEKSSLADLLKQGGSKKCNYVEKVSGLNATITAYIANGIVRTDSSMVIAGKNYDNHSILKDGYAYVWGSQIPGGFKVSTATTPNMDAVTSAQKIQSVNINDIVTFSCENWNYDATVLTPPADIDFKELNTTVPTGVNTAQVNTNTKALQCAGCDKLPASLQAQCKQSLNCQ